MEDFGKIIFYIVAGLIYFLWKNRQQAQKRNEQQRQRQEQGGQQPNSQPTLEDLLKEFGVEVPTEEKPAVSPVYTAKESKPKPKPFSYENDTQVMNDLEDDLLKQQQMLKRKIKETEAQQFGVLEQTGTAFGDEDRKKFKEFSAAKKKKKYNVQQLLSSNSRIKDAIVMSEILNRKAY